jgi:putative ABC transport system permease protein
MLTNLLSDARYSVRGLVKRPAFAVIVVLTLAVGIGVNVAMYSIFQGMVLRPIPEAYDPHALVNLAAPGPGLKQGSTSCNLAGDCEEVFSYPMFRDLERVQEPFTGIAAHTMVEANLAFHGETLSGTGVLVSGSYFGLLGVQPALGRLLGPQDDSADGSADSVVLSHRYWQNALGANPSVVGQALVVNGKPLTIVGVASRGFQGTSRPATPDVFLPITFRWRESPRAVPNFDDRRNYWVYLFARLKPGVSAAQAEAAINQPYRAILNEVEAPLQIGMTEQALTQFRAKTITIAPGARGQSWMMTGATVPLSILLVSAATVLLIACVNIANLMLARGATRVGEMAVRLSIGAAPRRLVALLFTESVVLALLAALASLPLTLVTLRWIESMVPAQGAASFAFSLNAALVAIAVAVALVSTLIFALFPVLKLARTQPGQVMHSQSTRSTGAKAANRFRVGLVTAQIALSMMLLVLAGLLAQSLANVARVDLGIRVESLLSFSISPERNGYTPANSAALFSRVEEELAALPGVTSVASSLLTLLANNSTSWDVRAPGFEPRPGTRPVADFNGVSARFFETLDIPLLAGRDFDLADAAPDRPKVAIVNQRFVEYFGLGANAVGTRIGAGQGDAFDIDIVGVVRDAKYDNVKDPIIPQLFQPRGQFESVGTLTFYVRNASEPETATASIRDVVARLDPSLPIMNMQTVDRQVRENLFLDRFMGTLAAALAVLATLLAAVGLYGVLSYMVAQRTREIGLRMALGAPPEQLRGMVLRQVSRMGGIGGAIGLGAAVLLGQAASALLFGVQATDPLVLLAAVGMLAVIVFVAGYLPARRASRVDPVVALRAE